MNSTTMLTATKVAPSGLPTAFNLLAETSLGSFDAIVVLRRKSCVTAMPIDANEREVRSHARKVRSGSVC